MTQMLVGSSIEWAVRLNVGTSTGTGYADGVGLAGAVGVGVLISAIGAPAPGVAGRSKSEPMTREPTTSAATVAAMRTVYRLRTGCETPVGRRSLDTFPSLARGRSGYVHGGLRPFGPGMGDWSQLRLMELVCTGDGARDSSPGAGFSARGRRRRGPSSDSLVPNCGVFRDTPSRQAVFATIRENLRGWATARMSS